MRKLGEVSGSQTPCIALKISDPQDPLSPTQPIFRPQSWMLKAPGDLGPGKEWKLCKFLLESHFQSLPLVGPCAVSILWLVLGQIPPGRHWLGSCCVGQTGGDLQPSGNSERNIAGRGTATCTAAEHPSP